MPYIVPASHAMALPKWQFMTEEDPWNWSAFVSATTELCLSVLLLLGVAISFFTSRFVKIFGLEASCAYKGCSNTLLLDSKDNQEWTDNLACKQRNQRKRLLGQAVADDRSNSTQRESYPALSWARSNINRSPAEDPCKIFQARSSCEQQGDCYEAHVNTHGHGYSSSSSSLQMRRGRSKRPRRRDSVGVHSKMKLIKADTALLSTGSNSETKVGADKEDHAMICREEAKHLMAPAFHLDQFDAVMKDAVKGEILADLSNVEANVASTPETHGGSTKEIQFNNVLASAKSEHERECPEGEILPEGFSDHVVALAVEDADKVLSFKSEKIQGEELLTECSNDAGKLDTVAITEHSNNASIACEDNQYAIQFGSIVARIGTKDEITNVSYGNAGNFFPASAHGIGGNNLGKLGCSESWTKTKSLEHGSIAFVDAAASNNSFINSMATNDVITCTIDGSSEVCFEETPTLTHSRPHLRSLSENNEDDEEAIPETEQAEDLDELKLALQADSLMLAALEVELENERNAAAVATREAMAMIARLQEEKSAMQMEVTQLQRMSEERAEYDEQAMELLKEILVRREAENMALEKEIELYREKLLAPNAGEPNERMFNELGSPIFQSHPKPLLIAGPDIVCCSNLRQQAAKRESSGTPQNGAYKALEELTGISTNQTSNKRFRGYHDGINGLPFEQSIGTDNGRDTPHVIYEQVAKIGKSLQFSDGETSTSEGGFVSAKSIQEHPGCGKMTLREELIAMGGKNHRMASDVKKKVVIDKVIESCVAQSNFVMRPEGGWQEDGETGVFVPIHDVYEVHPDSDRGPPTADTRELQVFDGGSTDKDLRQSLSDCTPEISGTSQQRSKSSTVIEESPRSPASLVQETSWDIEKSFYADDLHERHDLQTLSMVSKETRQAEMEEVKWLEARLKVLEEDRELMRVTVESLKHRDAELSMLQEISKHLQELRVLNFAGVSGGLLSEEICVSSPSRTRPTKKRRFCSGLGLGQTSLHHQRSV